jgi:maltose O-acetyltransferase
VGDGVSFDPTTSIFSYEHITIGRNVFVGWGAYFWGQIEIGDDVMFGPKVHLMGGYHSIDAIGKTIRESGGAPWAPIVVKGDVWVGARVTVMKGVTIGRGSVVGAESLVLHDIPPYVVAHGSPCHPIRKRFGDAELCEHLELIGVDDDAARQIIDTRNRALAEARAHQRD